MGEKEAKKGSAKATAEPAEPAEDSRPSTPPSGLRPFAPGKNSQTGEVHRRGPDRKPRQVGRLLLTRALVAAKQKNGGPPIPGVEAMAVGLREIMDDHNHRYFLGLFEQITKRFDDAPDSGSGRTTVFLYPSEVEAEMKAGGALKPGEQQSPPTPPRESPLAGLEELEEPGG